MSNFTPTPEQQAIIDHIRDEPTSSLMVDARAGSSKTTTITLASQVTNTSPNLAVAFNKRIAVELSERLPEGFTCKTLNSIGHTAWGSAIGKRLQLDADKMFKIVKGLVPKNDNVEDRDVELFNTVLTLARAAKSSGLVPTGAPMMRTGIIPDDYDTWEEIGFQKGMDVTDEYIALARKAVLESINRAYDGEVDFDDQIYMSALFGGRFPSYHTVIVDEAQDLSTLNHMMVLACAKVRLIAVGDPYQAIYAFRGADSNSMTNLRDRVNAKFEKAYGKMVRLGLTYSFRTPKSVSLRQIDHVPDFKSWATCHEGVIERWPAPTNQHNVDDAPRTWKLSEIPRVGAILCRNNAPLMKLGFALIKQRRPVKILGRDIGASLANLLKKIAGRSSVPIDDCWQLIEEWKRKELEKAKDSDSRREVISDRAECLHVLCEASGAADSDQAQQFIKDLFSDKAEGLVLSSGHRSKGLEWDWVMHLDSFRVPSKMAKTEAAMNQELNLRYVIETRTKKTLVFADLDDCEDIGE